MYMGYVGARMTYKSMTWRMQSGRSIAGTHRHDEEELGSWNIHPGGQGMIYHHHHHHHHHHIA